MGLATGNTSRARARAPCRGPPPSRSRRRPGCSACRRRALQLGEEAPRVLAAQSRMSRTIARGRNAASALARLAQRACDAGHLEPAAREVLLVEERRLDVVLDEQDRQRSMRGSQLGDRPRDTDLVDQRGSSRERGADARARSSTETVPPSSSASLRQSGSPRPVPLTRRWSGLSICANSWKMRSWSSGRDADPGVGDANRTVRPSAAQRGRETRTSPRSVNFSAFEMKLRRICETFASSV